MTRRIITTKTKNLEKEIKEGSKSIEIPEEHRWRQEELGSVMKEYSEARRQCMMTHMCGAMIKMAGLVTVFYGFHVEENLTNLDSYIGLAGLAWIAAELVENMVGKHFDSARGAYFSAMNKFDNWRFANDKNGYEVRNG